MKHYLTKLFVVAVFLSLSLNAWSDPTIYETYSTYNGNAFAMTNGLEIGNEITLDYNNWTLTGATVEYYTPNTYLSPSVGVRLRMYLNDGTPFNGFPTPGDLFFDSGWFYNTMAGGLPGNFPPNNGFNSVYYDTTDFYGGASSLLYLPPGFVMPTTFTLTVAYTNLDGSNLIDSPLANPPTGLSGSSYGDYWLNDNGSWALLTNATVNSSLVVSLSGVTTVPEPSVFYLGAIGSALLLGFNKLKRKR